MFPRRSVTCGPETSKGAITIRYFLAKSSTQVKHFILRQGINASMTRSIDHIELDAAGWSDDRHSVARSLRRRLYSTSICLDGEAGIRAYDWHRSLRGSLTVRCGVTQNACALVAAQWCAPINTHQPLDAKRHSNWSTGENLRVCRYDVAKDP